GSLPALGGSGHQPLSRPLGPGPLAGGQVSHTSHESSPEDDVMSRLGLGKSRIAFGGISGLASCMLAVTLVIPAANSPAWTIRLAIHYLPPTNSLSQYDVV